MTYKNYGDVLTMQASTSIEKYRFVGIDTAGERKIKYPADKGEIVGATENAADAGQSISVALRGVVEVEGAEAIAIWDKVSTNVEGKAVKYTDGVILGTAFTAITWDGERLSVLIK